jgi:hypothetical protein
MNVFLLALLLGAATLVEPTSAAAQDTPLAGMDFYDGVVRLDQIAAVIIRVR